MSAAQFNEVADRLLHLRFGGAMAVFHGGARAARAAFIGHRPSIDPTPIVRQRQRPS
jgi:hypothetical protein